MEAATLFRALGDPIRLQMVERLATSEPQTITTVSRDLHITRQGARKHLQVLADADLVTLVRHGRDTTVLLDRATLEQGRVFIAEMERRWDVRLAALKTAVEN